MKNTTGKRRKGGEIIVKIIHINIMYRKKWRRLFSRRNGCVPLTYFQLLAMMKVIHVSLDCMHII